MKRHARSFTRTTILTVVFIVAGQVVMAQRTGKSQNNLTVSFISIGAGIDYKAENRFLEFVKNFQQKYHIDTLYKLSRWGKEGETDYNFYMKKLSTKQKKELKDGLTKLFEGNTLVTISDKPRH